jgi:hypothetical protein
MIILNCCGEEYHADEGQIGRRIKGRAATDIERTVAQLTAPAPGPKFIPIRPLTYTPRPETGTWVVRYRGQGGRGQLEIKNDTDSDSVVKLISASIPREIFWVIYIRAHDAYTIKGVRPGSYLLRFAQGSEWDGPSKRFLEDAMFYEADADFDFTETRSLPDENGRYSIEYAVRQVTLNPVFDGNIQRKEIDEAAFNEGEADE